MRRLGLLAGAAITFVPTAAEAATLQVGPGKTYAKPCQAIAAAQPGDTIQVDASGNYAGDTCAWSTDNLTITGVNGRAKIDDTGVAVAEQKGIFVIHAPTATIENFELTGASISAAAGNNGAGIRHQGLNLTVRGCYIHDNQDGILGAPADSTGAAADGQGTVLIEHSEFAHNGAGDGQSHNMYLNKYASFTLRFSYSHDGNVGHLVKSRAYVNLIQYNRITDETNGMASYEIDLPVAGTSYVIGNLVEQSPTTQNDTILTYGEEPNNGINPDTHLFVVNNTFLNDYGRGTFVRVDPGITTPALVENDVFEGGGTDCSQGTAMLATNFDAPAQGDPKFVNQGTYDLMLQAGSPCIDKGTAPGKNGMQSLAPAYEYIHPLNDVPRVVVGSTIDIGAYEYGNPLDAGAPGDGGGSGGPDASSGGGDGGGGSTDGGPVTMPVPMDASTGGPANGASGSSGGCGCTTAGNVSGALGGLVALLALAASSARRLSPSRSPGGRRR